MITTLVIKRVSKKYIHTLTLNDGRLSKSFVHTASDRYSKLSIEMLLVADIVRSLGLVSAIECREYYENLFNAIIKLDGIEEFIVERWNALRVFHRIMEAAHVLKVQPSEE